MLWTCSWELFWEQLGSTNRAHWTPVLVLLPKAGSPHFILRKRQSRNLWMDYFETELFLRELTKSGGNFSSTGGRVVLLCGRGVGTGCFFRSLPTQTVQWFCAKQAVLKSRWTNAVKKAVLSSSLPKYCTQQYVLEAAHQSQGNHCCWHLVRSCFWFEWK